MRVVCLVDKERGWREEKEERKLEVGRGKGGR